jgi:hypothetical protein
VGDDVCGAFDAIVVICGARRVSERAERSKKKVIGMRQWVRRAAVGALGVASLAMAGAARAQDGEAASAESATEAAPSGGHEALQISLQGSLVDYVKFNSKPDKDPAQATQPAEQESSSTAYGLLGSGFGVGIGYVWDDVLLGARAQFSTLTQSPSGGGDIQTTSIAFLPRVEYLFDTGPKRLYLAGLLSVEHASASATTTVTGGSSFPASTTNKVEDSSTRFGIGAAFGAHVFLNQSVSIDPEISVLPSWGSATLKTSSGDESVSRDSSLSALRVMFSVGLSGWLDTAGAPTPPPARDAQAVASVAAAPIVSTEPEVKPLSADIHLPNHRRLYLQVLKDPAQPWVLVRLTEPRNGAALRKCDDVSITSNAESIKLALRTHGDYYSTGRLAIRGLQLLGAVVDSSISVCGDSWQLGQESREQVQAFLRARRELLNDSSDADVPEPPAVDVAPPSAADAAPEPAAPSPTPPPAVAPAPPPAVAPPPPTPAKK